MIKGIILAGGTGSRLSPLTKVRLNLCRCGNPPENTNLTVSIRETYDGDDIVSNTVYLDNITEFIIDVVFPETDLTIDVMYYIVCSTDKAGGIEEGTHYGWNFATNDPYERGDSWEYVNNNWNIITYTGGIDFGFTTYWIDYGPENPEINGPTEGEAGIELCWTFHSEDPDDDQIKYIIQWGDDTSNETDYNPSGEAIEVCHTYKAQEEYIISAYAEDETGLPSGSSTFTVTIPRSKTVYHPLLLRLFERFPNAFLLLRYLLRLQ